MLIWSWSVLCEFDVFYLCAPDWVFHRLWQCIMHYTISSKQAIHFALHIYWKYWQKSRQNFNDSSATIGFVFLRYSAKLYIIQLAEILYMYVTNTIFSIISVQKSSLQMWLPCEPKHTTAALVCPAIDNVIRYQTKVILLNLLCVDYGTFGETNCHHYGTGYSW